MPHCSDPPWVVYNQSIDAVQEKDFTNSAIYWVLVDFYK